MKHISSIVSHTVTEDRKFAWFPLRTTSGKLIWLTEYFYVEKFYIIFYTHRMLNSYVYTPEEMFIERLSNGNRENDYSLRD